ncbi:hypothetical protein D3C73_1582320 [compost metagenome]
MLHDWKDVLWFAPKIAALGILTTEYNLPRHKHLPQTILNYAVANYAVHKIHASHRSHLNADR